jgi:hypothetical protein
MATYRLVYRPRLGISRSDLPEPTPPDEHGVMGLGTTIRLVWGIICEYVCIHLSVGMQTLVLHL